MWNDAAVAKGGAADAPTPAGVTDEQLDEVIETFIEAVVAFQENRGRPDPGKADRAKRMMFLAKDFSAANIAALVEALRSDPRLAGMGPRDELVGGCLKTLERVAPAALLAYLEDHRDLPDWQRLFESCNRQLLVLNPNEAIERFEQERAKGNADYLTTNQRQAMMLALAGSDPDRMLAMALSPELADDPDALAMLGGFVDDKLEKPADHLRFMAALRRAADKQPDSEQLATIRKDYVREMTSQLAQWPFDDVRTLVDGEFTAEEKLQVIEKASHRGDLEDRAKWADWFLGVDLTEWRGWIATQPQQFQHPLVELLAEWGRSDPDAGEQWLPKLPDGELREEVVLEFAWNVAERDPERAAGFLDELPDSKGRRNLEKR
ncbi:MAG: hypothetical protein KDN05_22120, partial [Verrucomicrobiae bacterium]|nr:hypothetical protein [Verrucomicrobiae bacterium]